MRETRIYDMTAVSFDLFIFWIPKCSLSPGAHHAAICSSIPHNQLPRRPVFIAELTDQLKLKFFASSSTQTRGSRQWF